MEEEVAEQLARLEARIHALEDHLADLRRPAAPQPPPPRPADRLPPPRGPRLDVLTERRPDTLPPPSPPAAPAPRRLLLSSETALKWGGVGLVVLALGFAVSTAISRGWIGPELQLAGAVGISLAFVAVGVRLRRTRRPWTHALCSGGVAGLFTTFASPLFLDRFDPEVALPLVALVAAGGFALARVVRSEWIAAVALAGGTVAWLVVEEGEPGIVAILAWFAGAIAVATALGVAHRWHGLRVVTTIIGFGAALGLAGEAETGVEQAGVVLLGVGVAGIVAVVPSLPMRGRVTPWREVELHLATALAPWAFFVVATLLDTEDDTVLGVAALTAAAVGALVAGGGRRRQHPSHTLALLLGAAVALTIALTILLDDTTVWPALAVQGAGLVVLARSLGDRIRLPVFAGLLLTVSGVAALGLTVEAWGDDAPIGDDIAHLVVIAALSAGIWQTHHRETQRVGATIVLGFVLTWLGSVLVHLPEGQAVVSAAWAVIGAGLLVTGAVRKVPDLGVAGLAVLGVTVGKLLLVDMREVDTLWRAGLFFAVGLALLRLGFLLPRWTTEEPADPVDESIREPTEV